MKRVAIFIDGNNFYHGLRSIYGETRKMIDFNFGKFSSFLSKGNKIVYVYYYNAKLDEAKNTDKFNSQSRFFNKLRRVPNLKLVLCKLLRRKVIGTDKYYYVLKEDDIHMAVDIVEGACENIFDVAILVSGDGDFVPAVRSVQKRNKIVTNVYFKNSSSRNLKEVSNSSLELSEEILNDFFD